ncbi:MAG: hypothetical protein ACUVUC_00995 [Thermoguttaceae bacterium]
MFRLRAMPRVLRMGASTAVVFVVYGLYWLLAVPWIEPAAGRWQADSPVELLGPPDRLAGLRGLFQPDAWELNEQTLILESDRVKLLWRDLTDLGGGKLQLVPCTMILLPGAPGPEQASRALILQAPEGALLTFDRPLDLRRGEVGRLKAGRLPGRVTLRSQGKLPGPEDDLLATASDIEITHQRLWTAQPIQFAWGRNYGRGADAEVAFFPAEPMGSAGEHGLNIGGVDKVTVRRIERLCLDLGRGNFLLGRSSRPADRSTGRPVDVQVEITCRGPMEFDPGAQVVTVRDHVDVFQVHPNGPSDQISGELLAVQFGRRRRWPASPEVGSAPPARQAGPLAGLEPRRIEVRGNPVMVRAPSRQIEARAERLQYDLDSDRLELEGPEGSFVRQGPNAIYASQLDYRFDRSGRLGEAAATGPGRLALQAGGQAAQPLVAEWGQQLRLQPQGHEHVVSLSGGGKLTYGILGTLKAAQIHVWLQEVPASQDRQQTQIVADRVLAQRDVEIQSPQFSGTVSELGVWFEPPGPDWQPRSEQQPAVGGPGRAPAPGGSGGASGSVGWPPQTQPRVPTTRLTGAFAAQHFHLEANLLKARVVQAGPQAELAELVLEQDVRLTETRTPQAEEKPIQITGDRIHVVEASRPYAAATVTGRSARVQGRGLALSGPVIHLNGGTNQLRVEGPGQLELPLDRDLGGRPLRDRRPLAIAWQHRMVLDGRTAIFEESVDAAVAGQRLRAEAVEAVFAQPIRLADPHRQPRPELQRLCCRGGVLLEGAEFENGQQVSLERLGLTELEVELPSGKVRGGGPGRVTSVRREMPGPTQPELVAGRPSQAGPEAQKPLNCLDIRFRGSLAGNLHHRQLVFQDQVRAVYAPASSWQSVPQTDDPAQLGPDGIILRCDRLAAVQMPVPVGGVRGWDLEATGNTIVEGASFVARAVRISYEQGKGKLVLEGDGRADAILALQRRPGDRASEYRAQQISYWPRTGQLSSTVRSLEIP